MLSLIPQKSYKLNKENINYLFNMNKKERAIHDIRRLITGELEKIDFQDLTNQTIVISFSIVITLATVSNPVFASDSNLSWITELGNTFLSYAQLVGKWTCIIKAIITLIQAVAQDTLSVCWKKVLGYGLAALAIYKIPGIFMNLR